jgi:hypothetical protein
MAIVIGAVIVFFLFPGREQESQLLADYHSEDMRRRTATPAEVKPASQVED